MEYWDNVSGCSVKKAFPLKVTLESIAPFLEIDIAHLLKKGS